LEGIDLAEDQVRQGLAVRPERRVGFIHRRPGNEAFLSMTLIAPITQCPVLEFAGRAEMERIHDPMTVQEAKVAEDRMGVPGINGDEASVPLQGRPLTAESQQV